MQSESAPFAVLGDKLKQLRAARQESLAEAAGAVEIAEEELRRIELGEERPSEEILMLLISHFGMAEDDAVQLWELAGYNADDAEDTHHADDGHAHKTVVMMLALDPRVLYSDSVQVNGNQNGIVLNFMQTGGGMMPAMPVSRIGMSREQATKFAALLQETLSHLDEYQQPPKQLPPETDKSV